MGLEVLEKLGIALWQFLLCLMNRKLHGRGPHQAFFDEWGLEGPSWLFLAPPGSSWRDPTRANQQKRNCLMGLEVLDKLGIAL